LGQAQGLIQALMGGIRAIPEEMGRMAREGAPSARFQQLHGLAEELRTGMLGQAPASAAAQAPASDPLVVWAPHDHDPESYVQEDGGDAETSSVGARYVLDIAPDAIHKAGESGGGPYQVLFPDAAIDAPLRGDEDY